MKLPPLQTDLRRLRLNNLNTEEYRHLKLPLYWVLFGLLFYYAEHFYPVAEYYVMYHPIDDMIPYNELFVIPYMFWFVFLIGMHFYTGLYDRQAFTKLMKFIIITYTTGLVIFFLFPTVQHLRPAVMPRDNILTRFMTHFYAFDTNTNVCPSLHVVGSMAVMFTAWNTESLNAKWIKVAFGITAFLISISTVFLKQHSVIDVVVAFVICILAYPLCFKPKEKQPEVKYIKKVKAKI